MLKGRFNLKFVHLELQFRKYVHRTFYTIRRQPKKIAPSVPRFQKFQRTSVNLAQFERYFYLQQEVKF